MKTKGLTESEKVTMKCVWDLGEGVRLAHIMKLIHDKYEKNWKPQTVSTFLGKLVNKGFVEQYREGRYYYYRILITKEEYRCKMLREDMEFWEDGDIKVFVGELVNPMTFDREDRIQIQKCLK